MILCIWNCVTIPVEIAFNPASYDSYAITTFNFIIDFMFFLDIILNFRTTYHNHGTGEEVITSKQIASNYLRGGRFWIDILSTIPFDTALTPIFKDKNYITEKFQLLSMLKLFRVLRLSRIITYMNSTDEVKLSLRLFKLCLFLLLYIHCTACLLYYIANMERDTEEWIPSQYSYYGHERTIYEEGISTKYMVSFYNSILALTGNDIYPSSWYQYLFSSAFLISGALINANIFGTIAVIAATFNRKAQRF